LFKHLKQHQLPRRAPPERVSRLLRQSILVIASYLPLHATIDDLTLVVIWGNEGSKLGRSVYRLLPGGELEAVNSIKGQAGEWKEFGRAVLKRK